jgi:hypothetical protein
MNQWLRMALAVPAAFAFTVLMVAGAVGKSGLPTAVTIFCAYLIWPGVKITVDWLHTPLGDGFFSHFVFQHIDLQRAVLVGLPLDL